MVPREQYVAGGARPDRRLSLHGPPYALGDRCYLPYGAAGVVILDIADPTTPRLISRLDIGAAFSSVIAMHTVIPLPRRLAVVNTEAIAELSAEPYNFAGIVDLSDESRPRLISLLPPPVPHDGAPYPNFQTRGGRFGPHNQHHHQGNPHLFQSDTVVHLTWFNAGLRVYDVRDPWVPREIAHILPDDATQRRGLLPADRAGDAVRGRVGRRVRLRVRDRQEPRAAHRALHRRPCGADVLTPGARVSDRRR
ncbi:MAG TPA: hypothetical protein VK923_04720 [Euzebyales bacterium]|nr:hypothetical protein [Euzebyales bacterium]